MNGVGDVSDSPARRIPTLHGALRGARGSPHPYRAANRSRCHTPDDLLDSPASSSSVSMGVLRPQSIHDVQQYSLSGSGGAVPAGMQQRLRAIGGVPTPFAAPARGQQQPYNVDYNRQRSATSTGYVHHDPGMAYRPDYQQPHPGGGGSGGYISRPASSAAQQRRVNSEGELLSGYHQMGAMNYVTGS